MVASRSLPSSTFRMRPVVERVKVTSSGKSPAPTFRPNWRSAMVRTRSCELVSKQVVDTADKHLLGLVGYERTGRNRVAPAATAELGRGRVQRGLEIDSPPHGPLVGAHA